MQKAGENVEIYVILFSIISELYIFRNNIVYINLHSIYLKKEIDFIQYNYTLSAGKNSWALTNS